MWLSNWPIKDYQNIPMTTIPTDRRKPNAMSGILGLAQKGQLWSQLVWSGLIMHHSNISICLCHVFITLFTLMIFKLMFKKLENWCSSGDYAMYEFPTIWNAFQKAYQMVKMAYQMVMWHGHVTIWYILKHTEYYISYAIVIHEARPHWLRSYFTK